MASVWIGLSMLSPGLYNPPMLPVTIALIFASILQPPPAQQTPDVVTRARAVLAIVANDFTKVEEQFTAEMKSALPPGRLAMMCTTLVNQAGAYKSCGTDPRVRSIADKQMVFTPCEFERATIDIQFAFDSAGRISGLAMRPGAKPAAPYTLPPYANPSSFAERETTAEEFAKWRAALGARKDVTFHSYPSLNHLFIAGTGPGLPAEYQVPGHVAEEVVRDIATWILAQRR
jgi:hypothetical protein